MSLSPSNSDLFLILAFLRLSVEGRLLEDIDKWTKLAQDWNINPELFNRVKVIQYKTYEELELYTLEPTGFGQNQNFMLNTYQSAQWSLILELRLIGNHTAYPKRKLHQLIYQAIKGKVCSY